MPDYSSEYYHARSAHSRAMAAAAINPQIAAIHLKLAERYDAIARSNADGDAGQFAHRAEPATWRPALRAVADA